MWLTLCFAFMSFAAFVLNKGYKILKEFFYHLSSLDFRLDILNPFFWIARYLAKLLSTPSFILFMNNDPFILISFSFSLPVSLPSFLFIFSNSPLVPSPIPLLLLSLFLSLSSTLFLFPNLFLSPPPLWPYLLLSLSIISPSTHTHSDTFSIHTVSNTAAFNIHTQYTLITHI